MCFQRRCEELHDFQLGMVLSFWGGPQWWHLMGGTDVKIGGDSQFRHFGHSILKQFGGPPDFDTKPWMS